MGPNFDDYLGFQQIPGMLILLQQSVIQKKITYRFFFLRSKSPLGPAVDEGGGIPGCDIPMLMLSPEDV